MKPYLSIIFFIIFGLITNAQKTSDNDFDKLSADDQQKLIKMINLVDEGLATMVIEDFDNLVNKYPDNYGLKYERAFALYKLERYSDIAKDARTMLQHSNASERAFQLVGNAYDMNGDRAMAEKTYLEGLNHFPNSGALYLELGNIYLNDGQYNKALEFYNKGILAQPDFASNYYRASKLYMASDD